MTANNDAKPYAIIPNCETRAMEGIITSLGKRGIPLIGLSSDPKCTAFYSRFLTQKLICPDPKDEENFITYLIENVPKGVLLTTNDHTAMLFSRQHEILRHNGFLLNVPSLKKLLEGFDKWQCYLNMKKINIPCAKTYLVDNENDAITIAKKLGYPHIIKATRLAGGRYARINAEDELIASYRKMRDIVIHPENRHMNAKLISQEWLSYNIEDIWCVEAYYDVKGNACGFWPIQKWRTVIYRDGTYGSRLYAGECREQKDLELLSKKLLDGFDWRGFAHLDWVYLPYEKTFSLTEINPRLPGFSFFPSHAGFEMAYFYYADLLGESFEVPALQRTAYFEIFRHPGDFSSTLSACLRGQYTFKKFFTTYWNALVSRRPIVIDYFEKEEPLRTIRNILHIFYLCLNDLIKAINRLMNKFK